MYSENSQLFVDKVALKRFKSYEANTLRSALKAGRTFERKSKELQQFDNTVKSCNKLIKDFNLETFVNLIDINAIFAYNKESRFGILITKNGGKQNKLFTTPMLSKSTLKDGSDYFDFTFRTDRDQLSIDECMEKSQLSTMSRKAKETQRYIEGAERFAKRDFNHKVDRMTREERIELALNILDHEFGSCNVIKEIAKIKTVSDKEAAELLNKEAANIKRSATQKANVEKNVLQQEASDITNFKSVMPKLVPVTQPTIKNDKEEEMIVFMEEIKQEDPQLDSELLEVALESAPKATFTRPAVSTFLEDEDMDFYEPKPAIKLVNTAFEDHELAKYAKDKWLVEQKENGFDAFEQEVNDEYAAMIAAREEANSSWNYLNHSDNRYGSANYY